MFIGITEKPMVIFLASPASPARETPTETETENEREGGRERYIYTADQDRIFFGWLYTPFVKLPLERRKRVAKRDRARKRV